MADQNSKGNEGLIIVGGSAIEAPSADELIEFGGLSPGAARLLTGEDSSGGIKRLKVDLPGQFKGAVLIGEPRDTEITLEGPFTTAAKGGLIIPTAEQIRDIANGNLKAPDPLKNAR